MADLPLIELTKADALLRRVPDDPNLVKQVGPVRRPTSAAFKPAGADGCISVWIRRLLENPDPTSVLAGRPSAGLVEFTRGTVVALGLDAVHAPLPGDPAHGNVVPPDDMPKQEIKRATRELALRCAWIREPGGA